MSAHHVLHFIPRFLSFAAVGSNLGMVRRSADAVTPVMDEYVEVLLVHLLPIEHYSVSLREIALE